MKSRSSLFIGLAIGAILSLVFIGGFAAGAVIGWPRSDASLVSSDPNLQDFITAYRLVTKHSYYRPFDKHHLVYVAINAMLSATGDPHTLFLSPPENQVADQEINGEQFGGIGAIVCTDHQDLQVVAPLPKTPATQAGLRAGDVVTKINGRPVSALGNSAVARIHGVAGTRVRLTVVRSNGRPFNVYVQRAQIPPITAYSRVLNRGIGYLQIFSFGSDTAHEVQLAVASLIQRHVRGIVVDLRDNPGGYVDAAQGVVSDFVGHGVVAYERSSSGHLDVLPVLSGQQTVHVPVAVLVDGNTASAAEITAAALHDDDHAVIVGTQTYGKGSMQSVYSLTDGASIRITDRLWLTPNKRSIQGVGIHPDLVVRPGLRTACLVNDPQLHAATRYLVTHGAR